jgi:hypothetical protein
MAVNWKSTKFQHAAFVQGVATVAMFTSHLSGAEWIAASTIALGIYTAGDVAQKFAKEES